MITYIVLGVYTAAAGWFLVALWRAVLKQASNRKDVPLV